MPELETHDVSRPNTAVSDATMTSRPRADSKDSQREGNGKSTLDESHELHYMGGEGQSAIPEDTKVSFLATPFDALRLSDTRKGGPN